MIAYPPPLSLDALFDGPRVEPGALAEPHVTTWILPKREKPEFDTASVLLTMRREKLTTTALDKLIQWLDATFGE